MCTQRLPSQNHQFLCAHNNPSISLRTLFCFLDPCLTLFLVSLNIRVATIFLFSNFARIYHVWIYFTLSWNSWYTSASSPRFTFLIFCATLPPPVVRGPWQLKTSEVITCQNQKKMIATWNYVYAYMHM